MQTVYKCNVYRYNCKPFTNVNTQHQAGDVTERREACAHPRQGRGEREQGNVAGQRAGCERNDSAGSFAAESETSRQAQAAMCPISPQGGGGGLFADKWPAQASDRRQMCLRWSGATCLPLPCLFAAASEASALPPLGASRPLRSGVPCLVFTLGLAIMV